MASLPYPTENSFPWPEEPQANNHVYPSLPSTDNSEAYLSGNTATHPYGNPAPYPSGNPAPYPSGNPAPCPYGNTAPYPPAGMGMHANPMSGPFDAGSLPYPSDMSGSVPYPPVSYRDPSYPLSTPTPCPDLGTTFPDVSAVVDERDGRSKLFKDPTGLSKLIDSGLKIAEDALNKNIGSVVHPSPHPPHSSRPFKSGYQSQSEHVGTFEIGRFANQDYESLRRQSLSKKELFEDEAFPASNKLLVDAKGGQGYIVGYFGRMRMEQQTIKWMRPHEICQANGWHEGPALFVGESNRFDINQGEIGNCWFLAAMANLVENPAYFERVVPQDQSFKSHQGYCGLFRFRFWTFGQWQEVVVDDRLPTRDNRLIYLRSVDRNEFWGALLEKAYAKLHGSYAALEGGLTIEAAVDFTGGIPELIDLTRTKMAPETLFYVMSKADANNSFMGCALNNSRYVSEAQRLGLQPRHAYTVTKVVEIRGRGVTGGVPLVRLRNPHGNEKEWRGAWSDDDRHWRAIPSHLREELGLTFEDDGEFYMCFRDFLKFFGELEICHLSPDDSSQRRFEVFNFFGEWRAGLNAGGCGNEGLEMFATNPQFFVNINDPDPYDDETHCSVIISLAQKPVRRKSEHPIGFKIYACPQNEDHLDARFICRNTSMDRTDAFINLREVSKRFRLPQGRYCIVPCTFDRNCETHFLLRVFVETLWGSSEQSQGMAVRSVETRRRPSQVDGYPGGDEGPSVFTPKKSKSKSKKLINCALKKLEESFPQHAKGLRRLKDFYNWATDPESEFRRLNEIIKSFK